MFKLMSNQIISTIINLMQDNADHKDDKRSSEDQIVAYETFGIALCRLGILVNTKNNDNLLVKRWAKRVIIDLKYSQKP